MKHVPQSQGAVGPGAALLCFAIGVAVLMAKFIAIASCEFFFRVH